MDGYGGIQEGADEWCRDSVNFELCSLKFEPSMGRRPPHKSTIHSKIKRLVERRACQRPHADCKKAPPLQSSKRQPCLSAAPPVRHRSTESPGVRAARPGPTTSPSRCICMPKRTTGFWLTCSRSRRTSLVIRAIAPSSPCSSEPASPPPRSAPRKQANSSQRARVRRCAFRSADRATSGAYRCRRARLRPFCAIPLVAEPPA